MAGAQVIIMANQVEDQRLGFQAISLTHYDDNLEPQIAAGSVVEIGGALFEFSALESITGWSGISNNSDVYIKLTVSGVSVTASFTTTAPTWDTAKQGWYSGTERYIGGLRKDGSGNYYGKWFYDGQAGALGFVPIGSIVAWHKSFANTPPLPANFVECNGQVLSDPGSPYNGQTIPDLNATGRFIRGGASSGTLQPYATALPTTPFTHSHNAPVTSGSGGSPVGVVGSGGAMITGGWAGGDAETRPINISMVWIMRVK